MICNLSFYLQVNSFILHFLFSLPMIETPEAPETTDVCAAVLKINRVDLAVGMSLTHVFVNFVWLLHSRVAKRTLESWLESALVDQVASQMLVVYVTLEAPLTNVPATSSTRARVVVAGTSL